ncbi:uncharacterized protein LOC135402425 isoform X2 [Pseudopipra pipra]|uniref:uncharacterized protein LOC135402425 isoform X2 n=1 Tax=Pseudopipra pipra TaxID=415032 RepID=UPI003138C922
MEQALSNPNLCWRKSHQFFSRRKSPQGWIDMGKSPARCFGFFQEEYRSLDTDSDPIKFATEKGDIATDDTNKEQSSLHALVVLSSFLPTTALVAAVLFLLTIYIRMKRAGKGIDTGKHPAFRQRALQLRGHQGSGMAEGELSRSPVYAVIRPQQQPRPEDVLYANVQPAPKVFLHLQEPPGSSGSSGPVEYATVLFRTTAPHPDTATERNSFT